MMQKYAVGMQVQFDKNRPGSIAFQVERTLAARKARSGFESRLKEEPNRDFPLEQLISGPCLDDTMGLKPPDWTEFAPGLLEEMGTMWPSATAKTPGTEEQSIKMQEDPVPPKASDSKEREVMSDLFGSQLSPSPPESTAQPPSHLQRVPTNSRQSAADDIPATYAPIFERQLSQSGPPQPQYPPPPPLSRPSSTLTERFRNQINTPTHTSDDNDGDEEPPPRAMSKYQQNQRGRGGYGNKGATGGRGGKNRWGQAFDDLDELDVDVNYRNRNPNPRYKKRKPPYDDEESEEEAVEKPKSNDFITGTEKLVLDHVLKNKGRLPPAKNSAAALSAKRKKHLGTNGRRFVSPLMNRDDESSSKENSPASRPKNLDENGEEIDERLRNIDPKMIETIMNEMLDKVPQVKWDDIAGLELAKATIKEIVVFPMLRPDIFCGVRAPSKGLLLFGPPGTGKTLIGKCIASQCKATFFSISSSSLTSKWIGDGEKMVRALFAVARVHQPSVIFVDEIDSLLTQRSDGENEATRRIKTEFLVQFDGCGTDNEDRILLIGATNRPHEIDEAARRRFRKKLYIPLPEPQARKCIVSNLLRRLKHSLSEQDVDEIIRRSDGYSGSDMDGLIREAALGPIRDIYDISAIDVADVRPITLDDFVDALTQVKASVSTRDLDAYLKFDDEFGSVNRRA
ncbi:P-loop containing nucleoside triphosphate hydrolase protein [Phlyctochytrium arcticum]|nr:P-loop containing nucleoside triphosphate hydrolase protein [Phlyctochytrium arcticum]